MSVLRCNTRTQRHASSTKCTIVLGTCVRWPCCVRALLLCSKKKQALVTKADHRERERKKRHSLRYFCRFSLIIIQRKPNACTHFWAVYSVCGDPPHYNNIVNEEKDEEEEERWGHFNRPPKLAAAVRCRRGRALFSTCAHEAKGPCVARAWIPTPRPPPLFFMQRRRWRHIR